MGKKRISEDAKLQAVMGLLSGKGSHAEICIRYGISQTYLYKLRDQALDGMKAAGQPRADGTFCPCLEVCNNDLKARPMCKWPPEAAKKN